ncbi:MAG: hypothetical protein GQ542_14525 [Desulforhopalus sp.]|nr:hypothetical protein [Desulforhopalus sp.]
MGHRLQARKINQGRFRLGGVEADIAKVVGKRVKIMRYLVRWYMGEVFFFRLVAEIDEDNLKDVPDRNCKYGTS